MKRKVPGVRKLPSGRYQANVEVWKWKTVDGRPELVAWKPRQSFDTVHQATMWRLEMIRKHGRAAFKEQRRTGVEPRVQSGPRSIQEMIDHFSALDRFRSSRPPTQKNYRLAFDRFQRWCEEHDIHFVTQFVAPRGNGVPTYAQEFVAWIRTRHKFSGVTNAVSPVSSLFIEELRRDDTVLRRNPFDGLRYSEESDPVKRKRYMTREELEAVLGAMSYKTRLRFLLLFGSSMRTKEARFLTLRMRTAVDTIDLSIGYEFKTKTSGPPLRMLTPEAQFAFDELVRLHLEDLGHQPEYVLLGDRPASQSYFSTELARALKRARAETGLELKDITPHKFRKTFPSWMAQQGADMAAIRDILGHKSIRTTEQAYAFLHPSYLRQQMAKVPLLPDSLVRGDEKKPTPAPTLPMATT